MRASGSHSAHTHLENCLKYFACPLDTSVKATPRLHEQEGFNALFAWYKLNGRGSFELMKLPLEIRLRIYGYSMGNDIYAKRMPQQHSRGLSVSLGTGFKPYRVLGLGDLTQGGLFWATRATLLEF